MSSADSSSALNKASLSDLAGFFLRLGTTAFGGPAAHIAIMEDELVRRRGWVSREKFLDMLGASNLIPGPSSSELAIHIGYLLGGWTGLLVAGICFILPAACMVGALAWPPNHLSEPAARLRRIQAIWINRRALEVVDLPTGKVCAADIPAFALAIRRQDECTLTCSH
jgi:chromate transport protein ChrA